MLEIWKYENFGQGLNNESKASWKKTLQDTTNSGPHQPSSYAKVKIEFRVSKKRGGQVPLLKLQLTPTIVLAIDFCFLVKISIHLHVEGAPNFGHLWKFAKFATVARAKLSVAFQILEVSGGIITYIIKYIIN